MHKIIIITQHFYPELTSTAQLMTDLSKGFINKGFYVEVFTQKTEKICAIDDASLKRVKVINSHSVSPFKKSLVYKTINSLLFLISGILYIIFKTSRDAPVLIASNPPFSGILGICFKISKRGKFFFILQDVFPESAVLCNIIKPHGILFNLFSYLTYLTCDYSQATIVLSQSMKKFIEKKYSKLETKRKLKVINNWSIENINYCNKNHNKFAIQHKLTNIFTLLYSGNFGRLHDIESITKAAYILSNYPIKFVFIGNGAKQQLLEQYIQEHQLKNILLLPFQPRDVLSQSLTACDVSLVSLIEGAEEIIAPCKLYGMLAAGRAVLSISSTGSYIDQLLNDYSCGINCPPHNPQQLADMIATLAADPEQVAAMGQRARQLYEEKYTFSHALDEYEKLLFSTSSLNSLRLIDN